MLKDKELSGRPQDIKTDELKLLKQEAVEVTWKLEKLEVNQSTIVCCLQM